VWVAFGIICLVCLIQTLAVVILVRGHLTKSLETMKEIKGYQQDTATVLIEVLREDRAKEKAAEEAEKAKYEVGAFYPSDQNVAELERQASRAQDNFIPAGRPPRYSQTPSVRSGSASSQVTWPPPDPLSGRRL
jgi:hypothetical protein